MIHRVASTTGRGIVGAFSSVSRSRHGKAVLLLVVVVLTAGCTGFFAGDESGGDGAAVDSVPEGVDSVMHFEGAFLTDSTTEELMNGIIEMGGTPASDMGVEEPESWQDALDQMESESDLSVEDFESATVFGKSEQALENGEEYGGVIVKSDWEWEDFQQLAEEEGDISDVTEDSYNGVTVYIEENEFGQETWVADLGDGMFAFGPKTVVEDVIDTNQGDADPFSGDLRDAFESTTDGYMMAAMTVSENQAAMASDIASDQAGVDGRIFPDPKVMTMSYHTDGDRMNLEVQMTMETQEAANQVMVSLEQIANMPGAGEDVDPATDPMSWFSNALSAEQSDETVTMTFAAEPGDLLTAIETFASGGMMPGGPMPPGFAMHGPQGISVTG